MNNYAFPNNSFGGNGLTKREYFATHAPAEPQCWFTPALPDRPAPSKERDEDGDPINIAEINTWEREYVKQCHVQWPWAWADAVLGEQDEP